MLVQLLGLVGRVALLRLVHQVLRPAARISPKLAARLADRWWTLAAEARTLHMQCDRHSA